MNQKIHEMILRTMSERGLPHTQENYRMIASELGKRGAAKRREMLKKKREDSVQASQKMAAKAVKPQTSTSKKPPEGQLSLPGLEFESTVNYILRDLLF